METVLLGHWRRIGLFRRVTGGMRREAEDCAVGGPASTGSAAGRSASLSAGQFQRVLFARTLLQDCPVILLDEPFTAIDAKTSADLLGIVARWHGERRTVIAVLHDLDQVRERFSDALLLSRKPIAWGPTADVLRAEHLLRARRTAEAWDDRAEVCRQNVG